MDLIEYKQLIESVCHAQIDSKRIKMAILDIIVFEDTYHKW